MLLALAILMLLFEVIKGARPGAKYLTDHLLSLVVFGGAAAEFLLWPRFGSSTYFLLTMLALVDFLSGIALRARRGTLATSGHAGVAGRGRQASAAAAPQPRLDPAPEPPVPAATAVAESVLLDHAQPKILHSDVKPPDAAPPDARPTHVTAPDVKPPEVTSTHVTAPDVNPPDVTPTHVEPSAPSPDVASPDLQPGSSSPPSPDEPPPR
jgi:hypothetical protein